ETSADIAGTNLLIVGDLGWIDDSESGATNWFTRSGNAWSETVTGLEEGANIITVLGTNIYGHATNDTVNIYRQTLADVQPFIDITNAPANITFSETSADISGTNLNIAGGLGWIDDSESGATNWFTRSGDAWSETVTGLEEGANAITVIGTNIYGQSTNSVVSIYRKTWIESAPQIATNALIFPLDGAVLITPAPTNIIWNFNKITDDLDGTNLNISKISVFVAENTNEVATVTNNINNLLGEIPWLVPENLWGGETNYVLKFEVVDSSSLTNSRIFWDNKFTIVPEPVIVIGYLLSVIGILIFRKKCNRIEK
ncbi:MAG: hypothetical protein GY839_02415, partial [candidate division Zixibacteria bacterium]|nr:hypothetical protein [candidate division Zixibacteria bacterium]